MARFDGKPLLSRPVADGIKKTEESKHLLDGKLKSSMPKMLELKKKNQVKK